MNGGGKKENKKKQKTKDNIFDCYNLSGFTSQSHDQSKINLFHIDNGFWTKSIKIRY